MSRPARIIYLVLAVLGVAVLSASFYLRFSFEERVADEARRARDAAAYAREHAVLFAEHVIPHGVAFADFLLDLGLDRQAVFGIVESAKQVFDARAFRAGNRLAVGRSPDGALRALRYQIDASRMLWVTPHNGTFRAEIKDIPTKEEIAGVIGEIRDSLFNAVAEAGERPELALQLADIFGWDLDFYTDPRSGDTFRLAVEKKVYLNGQTAAYGRILAAEYNNAGTPYQAVLFRDPSGKPAYYAPDGKSLQKAFLRSPLKFSAPITSRFSRSRFHPILKIRRPHLGVDYAAPVGTPVQSIGDGHVLFAGRNSAAGGMVHIRHANGYETQYLHLSRILVRTGQHVSQGQRIGLVGATGLATGPHLDFRIRQHGAYRNFEALRLPPARPVAKSDWAEFVAARDRWMPMLPSTEALHTRPRTGGPTRRSQPDGT